MSRQILRKSTALITALMFFLCAFPLLSADVYADDTVTSTELTVTYGQTEARAMLAMINQFRTGSEAWAYAKDNTTKVQYTNLGNLTYDYELERIAMQRAAELAVYYSHTRPDGTDCFTAYTSSFDYAAKGENIAMGYNAFQTAQSVFVAWREDNEPYAGQGHRRNMLDSDFQSVGIGHAKCNGYDYWVQEFSSAIVDTTYAAPNDSETKVTVRTAPGYESDPSGGENSGEIPIYTSGDFAYALLENDDAIIVDCTASGDVVIPEYIDGHKVVWLMEQLFNSCYGITSISIPASVKDLGIWDYVFSYCYDLKAIYVDENNPELKSVDGVLYSKDMSVLYNYPCAKEGKTYTVPAETGTLCCTSFASTQLETLAIENPDAVWYTYTFYGDDNLTVVYKNGGMAQSLAESGTEYGPKFMADPNYVPPAEDPENPSVDPGGQGSGSGGSTPGEGQNDGEDPNPAGTSSGNISHTIVTILPDDHSDSSKDTLTDISEPAVSAPAKAVIKKLKPGRRSAKITIKAMTDVKYKVQYRIKGKKKWTTKTLSKSSGTFKKLKSGKKYQFRVRAYKESNGVTYYGKWSKIKTIKIK